jgi:hypothetical protein
MGNASESRHRLANFHDAIEDARSTQIGCRAMHDRLPVSRYSSGCSVT